MTTFLAGLEAASVFLFDTLSQIFNLYTTVPVLIAVFALWVLDRVFGIFKFLRG